MFDINNPAPVLAPILPSLVDAMARNHRRNHLVKAQVDVKAHESHAADGHTIEVQQHTMKVDKKALVTALAGLYRQGHATTFTARRQAAAYTARNPGHAAFEHDGEIHVVNKQGSAEMKRLGLKTADLTGKVKTGEVDTSTPDHLLASGGAALNTLRTLTPGTPEHKHVLDQYEGIQRCITAWNSSKGKTSTPADPVNGPKTRREEFARAEGKADDDLSTAKVKPRKPPKAPDFVKGGADKLKTPRQFELAARLAPTREEAIALSHYFNHHVGANGHTGAKWDAAWAELKSAIAASPTKAVVANQKAHVEKQTKLAGIHAQSAAGMAAADEHVKRAEAATASAQGQHDRARRKEADAKPRPTTSTPGEKVAGANRKRAASKLERAKRDLASAKQAHGEMAAVHAQVQGAIDTHAQANPTMAATGQPAAAPAPGDRLAASKAKVDAATAKVKTQPAAAPAPGDRVVSGKAKLAAAEARVKGGRKPEKSLAPSSPDPFEREPVEEGKPGTLLGASQGKKTPKPDKAPKATPAPASVKGPAIAPRAPSTPAPKSDPKGPPIAPRAPQAATPKPDPKGPVTPPRDTKAPTPKPDPKADPPKTQSQENAAGIAAGFGAVGGAAIAAGRARARAEAETNGNVKFRTNGPGAAKFAEMNPDWKAEDHGGMMHFTPPPGINFDHWEKHGSAAAHPGASAPEGTLEKEAADQAGAIAPEGATLEEQHHAEQGTTPEAPAAELEAAPAPGGKKKPKPAGAPDPAPSDEAAGVPKPSDGAKSKPIAKPDKPIKKHKGNIGHRILKVAHTIKGVLDQVMSEKDRENTHQT